MNAFEKIKERLAGAESVKLYGSKNSGNYLLPLEDALSIVSEVEAEYGNGWIDVKDRLPNKEEYNNCNGQFIVSDGNRTYATYFDIYDTFMFGEPTMNGFRIDRCVIAWMPLPSPYTPTTD